MGLVDLWLPILLSAVFVFAASSILHMCLPIHKSDFSGMPGEADTMAAMRSQGLKPGSYVFPYCSSMADVAKPEHMAKLNEGPVGFMHVLPNGSMNMGKSLGQWFAYSLVMSVFVGYVGTMGLSAGEGFMGVFRLTTATALIGYGLANATDSIWKGVSWTVTAKFFFDGVVYALVTGAAFGWLWPDV